MEWATTSPPPHNFDGPMHAYRGPYESACRASWRIRAAVEPQGEVEAAG